jgi:hypothetical protein
MEECCSFVISLSILLCMIFLTLVMERIYFHEFCVEKGGGGGEG